MLEIKSLILDSLLAIYKRIPTPVVEIVQKHGRKIVTFILLLIFLVLYIAIKYTELLPIDFYIYIIIGLLVSTMPLMLLIVLIDIINELNENSLDKVIGSLTESLKTASMVITKIEEEIEAREKLVNKLKDDAEMYNSLVELKKPEVEAVAQALRKELKQEGKDSLKKNVLINIIFFLLGVVTTILLSPLN